MSHEKQELVVQCISVKCLWQISQKISQHRVSCTVFMCCSKICQVSVVSHLIQLSRVFLIFMCCCHIPKFKTTRVIIFRFNAKLNDSN